MLDFDEALSLVVKKGQAAGARLAERVSLSEAARRVLVEEVLSPIALPSADYSAMDGYAVRAEDVAKEGQKLPVVGECQTGHEGVSVAPGTAVRIFTGAHIPSGADTVVMQENVTRTGDSALFKQAASLGSHIRRRGEDLDVGDVVLPAGTRLSGFHLGLLASAERTEILVSSRPRVVIVCTGDELRAPGALFEKGQLAESNSVALAALVEEAGGLAIRAPLARDDLEGMKSALDAALRSADLVITVGGVSVGDHDVVLPALEAISARTIFHKVKIKPGKPVLFAERDETLLLGLPGNPSSAMVNFALFGFPLVRLMQGDREGVSAFRVARLKSAFKKKPGRRVFCRGRLEGDQVELLNNQASGDSTSMAWANTFVMFPEEETTFSEGTRVEVLPYSDLK